jgi:hypothetical protein
MSNDQARKLVRQQVEQARANRINRAGAGDKFATEYWRKREAELRAQLRRLGG